MRLNVWTPETIKLLGTMSDNALASKLGVSRSRVGQKRRSLAIPPYLKSDRRYRRKRKRCKECGAMFECPPSDKTVTCSEACSAKRRKRTRKGHAWSQVARESLAKKQADKSRTNLANGTAGATAKNEAAPEENVEAKVWEVIDPDGVHHKVVNLRHWMIKRLGKEHGLKVYNGLRTTAACLRGKTKRAATQSHGWRLAKLPFPQET